MMLRSLGVVFIGGLPRSSFFLKMIKLRNCLMLNNILLSSSFSSVSDLIEKATTNKKAVHAQAKLAKTKLSLIVAFKKAVWFSDALLPLAS